MAKIIRPGDNFLHEHPLLQNRLDKNHVVVDRQDWEDVLHFFRDHSDQIPLLYYTHILEDSFYFKNEK